jgi:hypothetical protein
VQIGTPATLAQVRERSELIDQFAAGTDQPYPLTSADVRNLQPAVIGNSSLWSDRMNRFQEALVGEMSMIVADRLLSGPAGQGQLERVAALAGGDIEQVALWPYPEQQLTSLERLSPEEVQALQTLHLTFQLQVPQLKAGEQNQPAQSAPWETSQFRARMEQLLGDFEAATARYLELRLRGQLSPALAERFPQGMLLQVLAAAEDDARYWGGLLQYEQGEYARAAGILRDYLRQSKVRMWLPAARHLLGLSLAEAGQVSEAIAVMEPILPDDPYHQANQILARRWKELPTPEAAQQQPQ